MRRVLFFVAAAVLAAPAMAAQPGGGAPQLGRFFYTPAERSQLDVARMQKKPAQTATAEPVETAPPPTTVSYGGIVRRSDGRATLWINNQAVDEREALKGLNLRGKVRPDGAVTLQVPSTGGSIDVKVGQSVEVQSGRVAETRKPPPEAKPPADEPPPDAKPADGKGPETKAAETKPAAKPPAPEAKPAAAAPADADKKGPAVGLKMDLGGRTLDPAESARLSGSR